VLQFLSIAVVSFFFSCSLNLPVSFINSHSCSCFEEIEFSVNDSKIDLLILSYKEALSFILIVIEQS